MKRKNNEGFTLVELMVTIVVASIVTLAASTVLLLGIRLNKSSSDTAQQQNTVRIFLSVVERMATEGTIKEAENDPDSWVLYGEGDGGGENKKQLFYYSAADGKIYSGGNDGAPLMEDVIASHIAMFGKLLTVAVETEDGSYTTSVYCRSGAQLTDTIEIADPEENLPQDNTMSEVEKEGRAKFLKLLLSQRGSTGMVLKDINGTMTKTPLYYAEWYSRTMWEKEWDINTAWCGCFLTWGLHYKFEERDTAVSSYIKDIQHDWYLKFATVENCKKFFTDTNGWQEKKNENGTENFKATPGDIIFFDWDADTAPDHVGVVLAVKGNDVYTIEGNSANMVAVRKYSVNDSRIMGYGILDWKTE